MKKNQLSFTGQTKPRDEFLSDFRKDVSSFLEREDYEDKELHLFLKEIVKNVYDHNGGYGFVRLEKTSSHKVLIEFGNTSQLSNTSDKQAGVNFGVGLPAIQSALNGEWPGISLKIDTQVPYHYTITYSSP